MKIFVPVMQAQGLAMERGLVPARLYLSHELWAVAVSEAGPMYADPTAAGLRFAGLPVTLLDDGSPRVVTACGVAFPLKIEAQS